MRPSRSDPVGAGTRMPVSTVPGRSASRKSMRGRVGVAMRESTEVMRLADHFRNAPSVFTSSPLYRSLCMSAADDRDLLEILTERRAGQQPSYLLLGAVHYLLLRGVRHRLRDFYPSLVGSAAADPNDAGPVFLDFCRVHRAELRRLVRERLVQTNVVKRSVALKIAMSVIADRCDRPVHLIEVGASAGVHLLFDRYRYVISGRTSGPADADVTIETKWLGSDLPPAYDRCPPIAGRTGVDINPVDVTDPDERLWLRALVWPENQQEADLLSAAFHQLIEYPVDVIAGDAIDICPSLGRRLPPGEPRVVFHAATRMHVPPAQRAEFDSAIDSIGEHGPLFHVWQEPSTAPPRGSGTDVPEALAMHGPDGIDPIPLIQVDGHLEWIAPLTVEVR
ncbi:DUF2332 domain-containing protein [Actinoallomurus sp. NPDC052274]|uniref:DUF2332 domain-containing protein n=1 Tax=Actinoallomurus sp. NPDC052274 TaxID=3155420 RepID=UPI00343F5C93